MGISGICNDAIEIIKLIGWVLTIFKVVIPLLIVAFGMFDFGKAVTSGKDDDIKKSAKTLLTRAIAGIIIFFVPTIVIFIFEQITDFVHAREEVSSFGTCKSCLLTPWSCSASGTERVDDTSTSSGGGAGTRYNETR